jgi:hypothetical protein
LTSEWHVIITEIKTGEVVEDMKCNSFDEANQVRNGTMINGNTTDFLFAVKEIEQ